MLGASLDAEDAQERSVLPGSSRPFPLASCAVHSKYLVTTKEYAFKLVLGVFNAGGDRDTAQRAAHKEWLASGARAALECASSGESKSLSGAPSR